MKSLCDKLETLRESLAAYPEGISVAFSGGADSSLLLRMAHDVHREKVAAFHLHSPLHRQEELEHARKMAASIGARLIEVRLDPLLWPEFVSNPADRCYLCKTKIYNEFLGIIKKDSLGPLADGTNFDDLHVHRPGLRALRELGVITPLAAAALSKAEVREASRQLDLSTWDRPSGSCLATRIPSGQVISRESLAVVEKCESWLEERGFAGCRARLFGDCLLVELRRDQTGMSFFSENGIDFKLLAADLGIRKVYLDIDGR